MGLCDAGDLARYLPADRLRRTEKYFHSTCLILDIPKLDSESSETAARDDLFIDTGPIFPFG